MTITVDGVEAWDEHGWAGARSRVGDAVLRVAEPTPRCVVTTRDPDSGRRDAPGAQDAGRSARQGRRHVRRVVRRRGPGPGPRRRRYGRRAVRPMRSTWALSAHGCSRGRSSSPSSSSPSLAGVLVQRSSGESLTPADEAFAKVCRDARRHADVRAGLRRLRQGRARLHDRVRRRRATRCTRCTPRASAQREAAQARRACTMLARQKRAEAARGDIVGSCAWCGTRAPRSASRSPSRRDRPRAGRRTRRCAAGRRSPTARAGRAAVTRSTRTRHRPSWR